MKIKPKLKKTFAIFATVFLTLTLIVAVAPVKSHVVKADNYYYDNYKANIPFELISVSTQYDVSQPTVDTTYPISQIYSTNYEGYTYTITDDVNEMYLDGYIIEQSNYSTWSYGVYNAYIVFELPIEPTITLSAYEFIWLPYNEPYMDFGYNLPYATFINPQTDYAVSSTYINININYLGFKSFVGGLPDVLTYSKSIEITDNFDYYATLVDIYEDLLDSAYTNFGNETPIYCLEFDLTLNCSSNLEDVKRVNLIIGDMFYPLNYHYAPFDMFSASYFNANYEISWFDSIVNSVNSFLDIEILPHFSFGNLLYCVLAIPIAVWLLKLWLGG